MPATKKLTSFSIADAIRDQLNFQVQQAPHGRTMTVSEEGKPPIAHYDILYGQVRMSFGPNTDLAVIDRLLTLVLCECCEEHFPIEITNPVKDLFPKLRKLEFKQVNRTKNLWLCNST